MTEIAGEPIAQTDDIFLRKLQTRRRVGDLLGLLIATDDPDTIIACQVALLAAGRDALVGLARALETADPQAISRLGDLAAAYPDRAGVVALLRQEALDAHHSDLRRMATMVVLEQFLAQELDDQFFVTLRDPARVATESLVQVLRSTNHDRNLLLAYLSGLEEQQPAALGAVLAGLEQLSGEQGIEILKLLAQHEDEDLAAHALRRLSTLRRPAALVALRTLVLVAVPARRTQIERLLRKLTMAGTPLPPFRAPPAGARALLSGVDGAGASALWFLVPRADGRVQLLSLLLSDTAGVTDAFGGDTFSPESFPPAAAPGTVHRGLGPRATPGALPANGWTDGTRDAEPGGASPLDPAAPDPDAAAFCLAADEPPAEFLEIGFEEGRRLVVEHQALNWAAAVPLPWEYRLLHDIIWDFGPAAPPARPVRRPATCRANPVALLAVPFFQSWALSHDLVYTLAAEVLEQSEGRLEELGLPSPYGAPLPRASAARDHLAACADNLARSYFTVERRALYARRLRRGADWLAAAGDPAADLALQVAADLDTCPPARNPFVRALAERSILRAALHLLAGHDPRPAAGAPEG